MSSFRVLAVRLLVVALAPVVVLATTDAATAATFGGVQKFSFNTPANDTSARMDTAGANCSGWARLRAETTSTPHHVVGSVKCNVDVLAMPDPDSLVGTTDIFFTGITQNGGAACSAPYGTTADPVAGFAFDISTGTTDCLLDELCLSGTWTDQRVGWPDTTWTVSHCMEVTLPLPDPPVAECAYGNPQGTLFTNETSTTYGAGYYGKVIEFSVTRRPLELSYWHHWRVISKDWTPPATPPRTGGTNWSSHITNEDNGSIWRTPADWKLGPVGPGNLQHTAQVPMTYPDGAWIYAVVGPNNDSRPDASLAPMTNFLWGDNDPANCVFYIGPKFFDDPNSTKDEPHSDINTTGPPVDTEPEPDPVADPLPDTQTCNFSFTDPSSWLSGGMCALIGLIGKLIDRVGEVVSAVFGLPAKIMDGLRELFIPSDGFMDAAFGDISDAWDDTVLMKYADGLADLDPGGSSSCGGIPITVTMPGGHVIDERLGDACSGAMAGPAGMVRVALSVVLVVSGAVACVRAVGAGIGWNPGIGRKVDEA